MTNVAEEYSSSLSDLTVNSKPLINMLTMLAEDYIQHSPIIVKTVEAHLQKVPGDFKLPVLYLIDSIVKNVGKEYVPLFTQNIVSTFCAVFEQVDEKTRSQMFKLRQTWNEVFPSKKLYALDARVNSIDPAWPITAPPPRIHVNPKFLNTVPPTTEPNTPILSSITDTAMREELLKKQKELLELQKRKVELELLQTKAILEEQQKKLETHTTTRVPDTPTVPNPTKSSKQKSTPPEAPQASANKAKAVETKPEKSKFEGTKRRDPRLHSKKENDPRLNSKKETQQPPQGSPIKSASNKDLTENVKMSTSSENKKSNEPSSNNSSSRHQKKKSEKYKKHKDYKPRMKTLFGDSPVGKILGRIPKKSKHPENSVQMPASASRNKDTDTKSLSSTVPFGLSSESENIDTSIKEVIKSRKEPVEENVDTAKEISDPTKESGNPIPKKPSDPQIPQADVGFEENKPIDVDSECEPVPMEIDDKPSDISDPKLPISEAFLTVFDIDPPILKTLKENDAGIIFPSDSQPNDLSVNACGDTDLRLLPPQPNSDSDQPPEKKAKPDMHRLFGVEDVDLRQTLVPPPPPPPIISKSDLQHGEGWANFKRSNSDRGSSGKSPKKRKSIVSSPRSSCFRKKDEEVGGQDTMETEDRQNSLVLIMKEAEEQLKNETITYAQYNQMLKGVMSMNEENKLQEAMMKDDYERVDSPESGSNSSVDVQQHFEEQSSEPIDSYRGQAAGGDGKSGVDNLFEQSKNINDSNENSNNDHDSRRRSRFKNSEPYNRSKNSRHGRYYRERESEPPFYTDNSKGGPPSWIGRQQSQAFPSRSRKDVGQGRWQYPHKKPTEYPIAPLNPRLRGPRYHPEISLPPADPAVLDLIDSDPMTFVTVANSAKEVRFYGENAIIMMDWDDPRDLMFQPGSRRVFIDGADLTLQFNAPYREYTLNYGLRIRIRLGAPTRELFIDGRFYDVKFGGPPVEINLGGRNHVIQLEGPLPFLNIGTVKRTDLVAGKVNLIVDGKIENLFPIYLDAKPQRFEINGVPFIIRFVESLQTVVINGQPLKIPFGGIPVPIFFRGERHFLRLTTLPPGITPGFINIRTMEGGRIPTPPPPRIAPPPPMITDVPPLAPPAFMNPKGYEYPGNSQPSYTASGEFPPYTVSSMGNSDKPVDVLTSLMPPPVPRFALQNYQVEPFQDPLSANTGPPAPPSTSALPSIDVIELYQKLVAMGVVPQKKDKDKEEPEDKLAIKPVDFSKSETLKVKQPGLISVLYSGIQCSSCGVRFSPEQTVKYSQHLDWHFRQNRRERNSTRIAQSRKWNYDVSDWIQYQEIEDDEDRAQSWFEIQDKKTVGEEEEEAMEPTVSAKGFGENPFCTVCRDKFDQFFNEDKEEWQLKRAVCVDDKLYHPVCLKDEQDSQGRNVVPVMMPVPEDEPIETIDLDEAGDSGEEEKNILDTIEIESSSKSPQETEDKPELIDLEVIESASTDTPGDVDSVEEEKEAAVNEVEKMEENTEPNEDSTEKPEEKQEDQDEEDEEKEAKLEVPAEDSDDDILEIEVIEPHIESYDILDDDDEEELEQLRNKNDENSEVTNDKKDSIENNSDPEETHTNIVIKSEPIDLVNPNPITNTSHINETIYLDGNSEFSAPKVLLPKKIKINISSVINKNNIDDPSNNMSLIGQDENSSEAPITYDYTEPLPPGEEPLFLNSHLKPQLIGKRMFDLPPVNKGKEMSGLCSIM